MCSGVDRQLLSHCPPGENGKYIGIGGVVFFTACMAALSGTFALLSIFHNLWIALPVGIFWGLMIFNLDRYIVASLRKKSDQKAWSPWLQAMPRLLLALLFATAISKPLELRLFQQEIAVKLPEAAEEKTQHFAMKMDSLRAANEALEATIDTLEKNPAAGYFLLEAKDGLQADKKALDSIRVVQEGKIAALQKQINRHNGVYAKYNPRVKELERIIPTLEEGAEKEQLQRELKSKKAKVRNASRQVGSLRRQQKALRGPISDQEEKLVASENSVEDLRQERKNAIDGRIRDKKKEIAHNTTEIRSLEQERKKQIAGFQGLLAQLNAHRLLKEQDSTIYWASLAVFLLFIAVEIAPILVKLLTPIGPYDLALQQQEEKTVEMPEESFIATPMPVFVGTQGGQEEQVPPEILYQQQLRKRQLDLRYKLESKALKRYESVVNERLENANEEDLVSFLQELQEKPLPFMEGKKSIPQDSKAAQTPIIPLHDTRWQGLDTDSSQVKSYQFAKDGRFIYQGNGRPEYGSWRYASDLQDQIMIHLRDTARLLRVAINGPQLTLTEMQAPHRQTTLMRS